MFGSKVATKYLAWGGFEHFERVETFGVNSQELRRGLFSEGITPTGSVSRTKLTNEQYHMDEWTSNGYVQNWCKTATIITAIIVFRRDKSKFNRIWVVSQFVDGFLRLKTSKTPSLKGPTSSCSSFFVSRVAPHFETHEIGKKKQRHIGPWLVSGTADMTMETWKHGRGGWTKQWPPAGAQKSTMAGIV